MFIGCQLFLKYCIFSTSYDRNSWLVEPGSRGETDYIPDSINSSCLKQKASVVTGFLYFVPIALSLLAIDKGLSLTSDEL